MKISDLFAKVNELSASLSELMGDKASATSAKLSQFEARLQDIQGELLAQVKQAAADLETARAAIAELGREKATAEAATATANAALAEAQQKHIAAETALTEAQSQAKAQVEAAQAETRAIKAQLSTATLAIAGNTICASDATEEQRAEAVQALTPEAQLEAIQNAATASLVKIGVALKEIPSAAQSSASPEAPKPKNGCQVDSGKLWAKATL